MSVHAQRHSAVSCAKVTEPIEKSSRQQWTVLVIANVTVRVGLYITRSIAHCAFLYRLMYVREYATDVTARKSIIQHIASSLVTFRLLLNVDNIARRHRTMSVQRYLPANDTQSRLSS